MKSLEDLDIGRAVDAVIADDPDAAAIRDSLMLSLQQAKAGVFSRSTAAPVSPVAATRHKSGLSQRQFATAIGISVNTLKSWEQGQRQPSGAARVLLSLLGSHPELIAEIRG